MYSAETSPICIPANNK